MFNLHRPTASCSAVQRTKIAVSPSPNAGLCSSGIEVASFMRSARASAAEVMGPEMPTT